MLEFLGKLFDSNEKEINRVKPIVEKINSLEPQIEKLKDEQFKDKTEEFKKRLNPPAGEGETLDDLLPEAFALVREAAKRTLGQRHFDVQLIGGIVLHQGKIAEMKTGEGKTLVATLPLYLNALSGKGSHLVTVNDYLAKIGVQWMGPIYDLLGLSVSTTSHEKSYLFERREKEIKFGEEFNLKPCTRKEAYQADITYGQNNEFGFDYLRDNMVYSLNDIAQTQHNFVIVDEVDSILIDEARTPLIISAPAEESAKLYQTFARIVPNLKEKEDYSVDEKLRAVSLTDAGISKVEKMLGLKNLYTEGGVTLVHHLENALKAMCLFKLDKDYVVKDGEIIIVDEFTGRLLPGRRYSEGLHQAIEAKEGVEIKRESDTLATISFQNYFRMYEKLAGMTGTAATEAEEFYKIYKLEVISVPTNKPMIRKDFSDKIYKTEEAKFKAVVEDIKEKNKKGQPVLIGTISIEKNEMLDQMLDRAGVPHEILNAKNHEREAKIIAQAGKKGAVTLATNMAGRGVDIILGGNSPNQKQREEIVKLGGVYVIGTERHESRRIDNQLRGRSGRQGDPGSSLFYASLEDDLMRIFGGDRIKSMMEMMKFPDDMPIEHNLINRSIEQAQKKVEGQNFDIRKHLLEYDDVMNKHREVVYKKRKEILSKDNLKEDVLGLIEETLGKIINIHQDSPKEIIENLKVIFPPTELVVKAIGDFEKSPESISQEKLIELARKTYEEKEAGLGNETMRQVERVVYLRTIDSLWIQHLNAMEELREAIGLRGWGQRDPLVEYKHEAYNLFQRYQSAVASSIVNAIYKVEVRMPAQAEFEKRPIQEKGADESMAGGGFSGFEKNPPAGGKTLAERGGVKERNQVVRSGPKVGRNDPCPCGSGKKYKKCCLNK
ncbi:MAG: preprotein translocase subunit SecA [Candidatus Berkelbacteria bacterium]|nr:preprotein translocase subunit SecA [Candidatus Berkelbacteria bacterium]